MRNLDRWWRDPGTPGPSPPWADPTPPEHAPHPHLAGVAPDAS